MQVEPDGTRGGIRGEADRGSGYGVSDLQRGDLHAESGILDANLEDWSGDEVGGLRGRGSFLGHHRSSPTPYRHLVSSLKNRPIGKQCGHSRLATDRTEADEIQCK